MGLKDVIREYNEDNFSLAEMTPEEQRHYDAEVALMHAMFRRLTADRHDLNTSPSDDSHSGHFQGATVSVVYRPVDMGKRLVAGEHRQVLVQPVEHIFSQHCKSEYPEAEPETTSGYELEVFAVMDEDVANPGDLKCALYEGSTKEEDGITVASLGYEMVSVPVPGGIGQSVVALEEVAAFNGFLREVIEAGPTPAP